MGVNTTHVTYSGPFRVAVKLFIERSFFCASPSIVRRANKLCFINMTRRASEKENAGQQTLLNFAPGVKSNGKKHCLAVEDSKNFISSSLNLTLIQICGSAEYDLSDTSLPITKEVSRRGSSSISYEY